jgi:phage-related protein
VHRFQERTQAIAKRDVALAASEPAGLFEISLTKATHWAFLSRCAFFNFFRCSDAKQQIRKRETGRILYALLLGACVAKIYLLHFAFQNLRQEDRRVIAFANVTQHLA